MYSEALQAVEGVALYPLIGLILFLLCFGIVIIWTLRLDKQLVDKMAHIPLDGRTSADVEGETPNE